MHLSMSLPWFQTVLLLQRQYLNDTLISFLSNVEKYNNVLKKDYGNLIVALLTQRRENLRTHKSPQNVDNNNNFNNVSEWSQ